MAMQSPEGFDAQRLRARVLETYDQVAREPEAQYHFHRGPSYAVELLAYDAKELAELPEEATARFAGVGNPHRIGLIREGDVVLDHACGAGTDLLIAARKVGPGGKVIGVDMTPAMRAVAQLAARKAGLEARVEIREGVFEELPVEDESVDVVISNGVLNLAPDKVRVFTEIHRVLKPGGRLFLSDVVVQRELRLETRKNPELWAACIAGALWEPELLELAAHANLRNAQILERFMCFRGTSAEKRVSRDLDIQAVNLFARK
jgi:arsenite methyltransferase